jgi:hypothetical protein
VPVTRLSWSKTSEATLLLTCPKTGRSQWKELALVAVISHPFNSSFSFPL